VGYFLEVSGWSNGDMTIDGRPYHRALLGTDPANEPAKALYRAMGFAVACNFVFYCKEP
jgi:ribosomal protein S18 acetylase RimI-like enzyme